MSCRADHRDASRVKINALTMARIVSVKQQLPVIGIANSVPLMTGLLF